MWHVLFPGFLEPLGIVAHVTKWSQPSKWWWEQKPMSTIWNVSRANNVITGKSSENLGSRHLLTHKEKTEKDSPIFIFSFIADFASVIVFSFVTTKFYANTIMKNAWYSLIWHTIHPICHSTWNKTTDRVMDLAMALLVLKWVFEHLYSIRKPFRIWDIWHLDKNCPKIWQLCLLTTYRIWPRLSDINQSCLINDRSDRYCPKLFEIVQTYLSKIFWNYSKLTKFFKPWQKFLKNFKNWLQIFKDSRMTIISKFRIQTMLSGQGLSKFPSIICPRATIDT